ncbi:hypothetical protein Plhal703r1_c13g0065331 [Plasmopara halstedii]
MVNLLCAIVGAASNAFEVNIDDTASVSVLKKAVKAKKPDTIKCEAAKLELFLAKTEGGAWLDEAGAASVALDERGNPRGYVKMRSTLWIKNPMHFGDNFQPGEEQIHVLVVVPRQEQQSVALGAQDVGGKRVRVDEWFVDETFSVQKKKRKLDEGETNDKFTKYFKMARFPPLAHPMEKYAKIVERDAYAVVFAELMRKTKLCFEAESGANMVVTGNPGIGKSCFYLYCIFQLIFGNQVDVKELASLDLVLNSGLFYHKYDASKSEFIELNEKEVRTLSQQQRVLRLIEGKSSQLIGWKGVSILFAFPGLNDLNDYAKFNSYKYFLPVWTLEELQDYNILRDDGLRLAEDVLISRYDKYGGIPRFIFTATELENIEDLQQAIAKFGALDIISYAKKNRAVRDGNYSHRVLAMVPRRVDFRAQFHLDFLSKYIAEKIVAKVDEDSLQKVSEFAVAHANDDSGSTSVVRGKIYEMLCHRWFNLHKQRRLQFRSLCSKSHVKLIIPENMNLVRFSTLDV